MHRVSPSLLDSFAYYLSIEDSEKSADARQEILDSLRGIPKTSEAMEAGIAFENAVVHIIQGDYIPITADENYAKCVAECAKEVQGSIYQYHVEKEICGILAHGVIDFLHRNRIIDLKTTNSYEVGKYRDRNQHLIYLACLESQGINRFTYLITDFRNVYKEDYFWQPSMINTLQANIRQFLDYLDNDKEMREAFEEKDHTKQTWKEPLMLKGAINAI